MGVFLQYRCTVCKIILSGDMPFCLRHPHHRIEITLAQHPESVPKKEPAMPTYRSATLRDLMLSAQRMTEEWDALTKERDAVVKERDTFRDQIEHHATEKDLLDLLRDKLSKVEKERDELSKKFDGERNRATNLLNERDAALGELERHTKAKQQETIGLAAQCDRLKAERDAAITEREALKDVSKHRVRCGPGVHQETFDGGKTWVKIPTYDELVKERDEYKQAVDNCLSVLDQAQVTATVIDQGVLRPDGKEVHTALFVWERVRVLKEELERHIKAKQQDVMAWAKEYDRLKAERDSAQEIKGRVVKEVEQLRFAQAELARQRDAVTEERNMYLHKLEAINTQPPAVNEAGVILGQLVHAKALHERGDDEAYRKAKDGLWERAFALVGVPMPMHLECPVCAKVHVDEDERRIVAQPQGGSGEVGDDWTKRPHKTHLCRYCNQTWRPEERCHTVGVAQQAKAPDSVPVGRDRAIDGLIEQRDIWIARIEEICKHLGLSHIVIPPFGPLPQELIAALENIELNLEIAANANLTGMTHSLVPKDELADLLKAKHILDHIRTLGM